MSGFQCCGVNGPDDLKMTASGVVTYPKACCSSSGGQCKVPDHTKGCYEKVLSVYETYPFIGAALVIVLLVVELSAMFLAVMLYREI
ncbi:tetraspanin-18-like [Dunckerocampus dactyliophorus]|uniref:tetraspanin-18-like n=1 Tax=Dunckerocampus dactyliophorus TaxID=161453 RepID=UPI0024062A9C|nr:tetraspanin-18-like [Dunckerocampus dactyliophorus]